MEAVYNTFVRPVLEEIVNKGNTALTSVPGLLDCIENSHKLGKELSRNGKTLPPCVIVRFMRREIRDLVIKNRKLAPLPGTGACGRRCDHVQGGGGPHSPQL